MASGMVTDTEIKIKLNQKYVEGKVLADKEQIDRQATSSRRHLDKEIKETKRRLLDIKAKTDPIMPNPRQVPTIYITHDHDFDDVNTDATMTLNPNVRTHTLNNMMASMRLSRSLDKREQKRDRSVSPLGVTNLATVSSRSIEELHKAVSVLKNTKHEMEVQKLLGSVTSKH